MPAQHVDHRTHRDLCQFALELLDETDAIVLRHLAGGLTVKAKADATLVTQADTEVETLIRQRIEDAFPDHGVLGEEFADRPATAGRAGSWTRSTAPTTWCAASRSSPRCWPWRTSGELAAAAISAPALARRWCAVRGEGAVARDQLGERPMHVSTIERLEEAQLVSSGIGPLEQAGFGPAVSRLSTQVWRDRGFGDFWGYMLVAEGAAEAMLEIGPTLWDLAAPSLIVARPAAG